MLTAEQHSQYDENGYLVIRGFFDPAELKPLLERFLAIVHGSVAPAPGMLVMRDVMVVKRAVQPGSEAEAIAKIQDFEGDPVLYEGYSKHPRLLDQVEDFVGPDIVSIHTMLINKPPHVDGRHPLHQDLLYFPFRPADAIVATSTALERVTKENGCLVVLPGSHKQDLLPHGNPDWEHVNALYFGITDFDPDAERVHLEMEPGDVAFFHPLLIHGSGRNRTEGFRRTILTHYASARCRYLPEGEQVANVRHYQLVRGLRYPDCL